MIQDGWSKPSKEASPTTDISIFTGELSDVVIFEQMKVLKIAFPDMQQDFTELLMKRIRANGFSNTRLIAAVENVVDSFTYKKLNIADIINFDVRVKFYTYKELESKVAAGEDLFSNYEVIDIGIGKPVRVRKEDFVRYGFKRYVK